MLLQSGQLLLYKLKLHYVRNLPNLVTVATITTYRLKIDMTFKMRIIYWQHYKDRLHLQSVGQLFFF